MKTQEQSSTLKEEVPKTKTGLLDKYKKDDGVTIGINIKGREWINNHNQKKFFNSIQGWKIEKAELKKELQLADQNQDRENDFPF